MPKTKNIHQKRFNPYGYVRYEEPKKMFKCSIDKCGAIFPYKSVLQVHQIKQHANESRFKKRQVAIVKPMKWSAPVPSPPSPQKVPTLPTKQPKIILKDILAKEHYIVDEHDRFTCPICAKSTFSTGIAMHLRYWHKSLLKFIKPKVKCADCNELVHPNSLTTHKRTTCKGETGNQQLLALCDAPVKKHQSLRLFLQREQAASSLSLFATEITKK